MWRNINNVLTLLKHAQGTSQSMLIFFSRLFHAIINDYDDEFGSRLQIINHIAAHYLQFPFHQERESVSFMHSLDLNQSLIVCRRRTW